MRHPYQWIIIAAVIALLQACMKERTTTLYLTAPTTLAGAEVMCDEKVLGRLSITAKTRDLKASGAVGIFKIPTGHHAISIRSDRFMTIIRRVRYAGNGEDYQTISESEAIAKQANPGGRHSLPP